MILKALAFYRGKCDGIWSTQTTKAKQEFEVSPTFKPAYPSRGLPFTLDLNSKYPKGIHTDSKRHGMLTCEQLTNEQIKEWSGDLKAVYDNRKETLHVPKPDTPLVEAAVVTEPEPELDLDTAREKQPKFSGQNQNRHNKKR